MWQRLVPLLSSRLGADWFCSVSSTSRVLDEETYLYIAEQIQPKRPYDWILPWPPYDTEDAFVFAHPPLFLWWIWLLTSLVGAGVGASKLMAALPFQVMLGAAAAVLCPSATAWLCCCSVPRRIVSLFDCQRADARSECERSGALQWRSGGRGNSASPMV